MGSHRVQTYRMILLIIIHGHLATSFNEKKCKSLHIGQNNPEQNYNMNGHILEDVTMQNDLGIIIDRELKFHKQTAAAVKKANQVFGIIKENDLHKK